MRRILVFVIAILLLTQSVQAALTFGAATTDRVDYGSRTVLDNLDPYTWCAWIYPTTLTANRQIISKSTAAPTSGKLFGLDAAAKLRTIVNRATTDTDYRTNAPGLAVNNWYFTCATFNSGAAAGQIVNIYVGTGTTSAVTESTYGTATDGDGGVDADGAINLDVGNLNAATPSLAFQGRIAWAGVWNRELSFWEILDQQFHPHVTTGNVLFTHVGYAGTGTQPDWSGNQNAGTVTGASLTPMHAPISVLFGFDDFSYQEASTVTCPNTLLTLGAGC